MNIPAHMDVNSPMPLKWGKAGLQYQRGSMDNAKSKTSGFNIILFLALILLLFTGCTPEKAIYAWFPDGRVSQISPNEGFFYQSCIHPEGTHVVCSGNISGAPRIWKMKISTKERVALSPENAASIHGVFSWDGKKIAFASDMASDGPTPGFDVNAISEGGTPPPNAILNIFVMDADGSNIKQLTSGAYQDSRPTFSPDGKCVVFVNGYLSGRKRPSDSRTSTLWAVPTDGSRTPEVIPMDQPAYRPWFSADGERLYFFVNNSLLFRHQIHFMPVEGGDMTPLAADDKGWSHGPFVDPSGDSLLMHSNRDGMWKVYEISLLDGELRLMQPPGFESINASHATRAANGVMTFDSGADPLE